MALKYTLRSNKREARARSKRLRELGTPGSGGGSTVVNITSGETSGVGLSHTHANKTALDQISTDSSGYQYLTRTIEILNEETGDVEVKTVTERVKAGYADKAGIAAEADNAKEAEYAAVAGDLDPDSPVRREMLSRVKDDTASGLITFLAGLVSKGLLRAEDGLRVVGDALLGGPVGSMEFVSGMPDGTGWRIVQGADGRYVLEIDELTVRGGVRMVELLVEKIRTTGGVIVVSPGSGRVARAVRTDAAWLLTMEDGGTGFAAGDFVRCARFSGSGKTDYLVRIAAWDGRTAMVDSAEFGAAVPMAGDELVTMGSEDPARQGYITISARENGHPTISLWDGVADKHPGVRNLRTRVGYLGDIEDPWFEDRGLPGPHGHGLYSDNAWLHGVFILANGEDVATSLQVLDGKIASAVEAVRADFDEESGILINPCFERGFEGWRAVTHTQGAAVAGNAPVMIGAMGLLGVGGGVRLLREGRADIVTMGAGCSIRQVPSVMRTIECDKNGVKLTLGMMVRSTGGCSLEVMFGAEVLAEVTLSGAPGWRMVRGSIVLPAVADGTGYVAKYPGTFLIAVGEGEVEICRVALCADMVAALGGRFATYVEQTEKRWEAVARVMDLDSGEILAESGVVTEANYASMYSTAKDAQGKTVEAHVKAAVKNGLSTLELSADQIRAIAKDIQIDADQVSFEKGNVTVKGDVLVRRLLHDASLRVNRVTSAFWCSSLMGAFAGETPIEEGHMLFFPRLKPGEAMETTVIHFPSEAFWAMFGTSEVCCVGEGAPYEEDGDGNRIWYDDPAVLFVPHFLSSSAISRAAQTGSGNGVTQGGGTLAVLPDNPNPVKPSTDIYEVVSDRFIDATDMAGSVGVQGVWKFYGIGLELTLGKDDAGKDITDADGNPLNYTYWVAIQIR